MNEIKKGVFYRFTRVSSFFLKFMQPIEIIDFFKTQHFI